MNNSQIKRQRLNYNRTDRINHLPHGILIHILSFLPNMDVVWSVLNIFSFFEKNFTIENENYVLNIN